MPNIKAPNAAPIADPYPPVNKHPPTTAAAIEAHKHHRGAVVTVAMDEIEFKQPVFVGDVVSYYATTHKLGRTSVTIDIDVFAQRQFAEEGDFIEVTSARAVMVAIDENNKPTALNNWKGAVIGSIVYPPKNKTTTVLN